MELEPIGNAEPDEIDLDPIIVPIVAWRLDNGKKEIVKFAFRPTLNYGATFQLFEGVGADGNPRPGSVPRYLEKCLMPGEVVRWREFLESEDLAVEQETIVQTFNQLAELYGARPTVRRSGSSGTPASTKQTSPAVARARASRSKTSRSRPRST